MRNQQLIVACVLLLAARFAPGADNGTWRSDNLNTGANLLETVLTPANVRASTFGKQFTSPPLDGDQWATPLYLANLVIGGRARDVMFASTTHDSVYAFDADDGTLLWSRSLLQPGERPLTNVDIASLASTYGSEIGITATPVIDRAAGTMYVLTDATTAAPGGVPATNGSDTFHRLHALSIGDGSERTGSPVVVAGDVVGTGYGPGYDGLDSRIFPDGKRHVVFNAYRQNPRPALLLSGGVVYTASASYSDHDPYHGWVMGYRAADLRQVAVYCSTPNGERGGIWLSGGKPGADAAGAIYVVTGNGSFGDDTDRGGLDAQGFPMLGNYGTSVIKLVVDPGSDPTRQNRNGWGLTVADYFTPSNVVTMNTADWDIAGGPMLLPDTAGAPDHPHLMMVAGKEGRVWLIDRDDMGKFTANGPDRLVQVLGGSRGAGGRGILNPVFSTPAYFNDGVNDLLLYDDTGDNSDSPLGHLNVFRLAAGRFSPLAPLAVGAEGLRYPAPSPVVSAAGTANGVVWILESSTIYTNPSPFSRLRAYAAATPATPTITEIYDSDQVPARDALLPAKTRFTVPVVANGHVYVAAANRLYAFGLLGVSPPRTPGNVVATATDRQVTLTWDTGFDATGYHVYRRTAGNAQQRLTAAPIAGTSYADAGLSNGSTYFYQVSAVNAVGESAPSSEVAATPAPTPPPAADRLVAVPFNARVNLTWNATPGAQSYNLYRGTAGSASGLVAGGLSTTAFSDLGLINGTTYSYQVSAVNAVGEGPRSAIASARPASEFSLWDDAAVPTHAFIADQPVELGVRFRTGVAGYIAGIRFYKGVGNGGSHTGNLWTNGGQLLGTAVFAAETASGWQTVRFPTPVQVLANTTYLASYHTQTGYAYDLEYFATAGFSNPPLFAMASQGGEPDGAFAYGGGGVFPDHDSGRGTNYWVDVVFTTAFSPPPAPTLTATAGDLRVALSWTASAGAATYNLYRGTASGAEALLASGLTATTYIDTGVSNGTTYFYQVAGANGPSGPRSNEVSATPTGGGAVSTIWSPAATPGIAANADGAAVELGLKFRADVNGLVTGLRFYKGAGNTGAHIGHLWSRAGAPLAAAAFTVETASGWQQASFPVPVAIAAGTTYIASYLAPSGHYAGDNDFFLGAGVDRGPLHALANGVDGGDGVYRYGGGFPDQTYRSTNYWVDVVFVPGSGGNAAPTIATAAAATPSPVTGTTATVSVLGADDGGEAQLVYDWTTTGTPPAPVAFGSGGTNAARTTTAAFTSAGRYQVQVVVRDAAGLSAISAVTIDVAPTLTAIGVSPAQADVLIGEQRAFTATATDQFGAPLAVQPSVVWTVDGGGVISGAGVFSSGASAGGPFTITAAVPGTSGTAHVQVVAVPEASTIWSADAAPAVAAFADGNAVELGVKFRTDVAGHIGGIRFYKGAGNAGVHVASLWSAGGGRLATTTFGPESASGWQQVDFPTAVAVNAGTTYVASYHAPLGHYAATTGAFATAGVDNAPLHALQEGADGGNGVYRYGAGGFPDQSFRSTDYWVDVVFFPDPDALAVPSGGG